MPPVPLRVLLADDQPQLREVIADTLTRAGFSVVGSVADGAQIVDVEATLQPEVLVVDLAMPHLSGLQAVARLRDRGSKAAIVCLTGYPEPELIEAAWRAGASAYVLKISMLRDLVPAIHAAIDGRRFVSPGLQLSPTEP